jgi:anti-sigma-K factor RskA
MHDLPALPAGKVYQAWTLPKGSKTMAPSVTFVPDARGVAVVSVPADARVTNVVAVSIEPEGGSKAPTSKPVLVVPLN